MGIVKKTVKARPNQKMVHDDVLSNYQSQRLYEAPTAFGKTHTLLMIASSLLKKGKKVIISTSNNNLARDMIDTSREYDFGLSDEDISLIIGKSNYLDLVSLFSSIEDGSIYNFVYRDSLDRWLELNEDALVNKNGVFFVDDFFKDVELLELQYEESLKELISCSSRPEWLIDFEEVNVGVTNHFYLLYRVAVIKNLSLEDHVVLFDEVHEIPNVAEQVFQSSFSPFNFNNIVQRILSGDDVLLKKEEKKELKGIVKEFKRLISYSIAQSNYDIGEYVCSGAYFDNITGELQNTVTTKQIKMISDVIARSKKDEAGENGTLHNRDILMLQKELGELKGVLYAKESTPKELSIYFSPSKGYPTFKASRSNIEAILHFQFWEKIESFFGFSATLFVGDISDVKNKRYAFTRLGLNYDEHIHELMFIARELPREQIKIYPPKEEYIDPCNEQEKEEYSKWAHFVSEFIIGHEEGKNSLVFAGGYQECHYLASLIKEKKPELNVIYSSPNKSVGRTIEEFKEKGGILIATRNYNTGISLTGKLLEKIFVLRLPYPIFTTKKWLDLRYKSGAGSYFWYHYTNEMILSFRQALGRLQRDEKDKGDIYLMDSRIFDRRENSKRFKVPSLKEKIWYFLEQYGVIVKDEVGGEQTEACSKIDSIDSTDSKGGKEERKKLEVIDDDALDWI